MISYWGIDHGGVSKALFPKLAGLAKPKAPTGGIVKPQAPTGLTPSNAFAPKLSKPKAPIKPIAPKPLTPSTGAQPFKPGRP